MKRKTKSESTVLEGDITWNLNSFIIFGQKRPCEEWNSGISVPEAVEQTHEPVDLERTKVVYSCCEMCTYKSKQRLNDV